MAEHEITMDFSNAGTRNEVRMRVVAALAKEMPGKGLNVELLVKVLKWLFIEQDIRCWNYSGREMLWAGLPRP